MYSLLFQRNNNNYNNISITEIIFKYLLNICYFSNKNPWFDCFFAFYSSPYSNQHLLQLARLTIDSFRDPIVY